LKLCETQSVAAIARALGLPYHTVHGAVSRARHPPTPRPRAATLHERYEKRGDGHWIWTYANPDRKAVWTAIHGAPPAGALGQCPQDKRCVNPAHLQLHWDAERSERRADREAGIAAARARIADFANETDQEKARRLREAGFERAVIARALTRSREWVYSHLPVTAHASKATRARLEKCRTLREGGLGVAEIARKTGIPQASVSRLVAMLAAKAEGRVPSRPSPAPTDAAVNLARARAARAPKRQVRAAPLEARYETRDDGHWIWRYGNPNRQAVWIATHGAPPEGPLGRCPDDLRCVNPAHLPLHRKARQSPLSAERQAVDGSGEAGTSRLVDTAARALIADLAGESEVAKVQRLREAGTPIAVIARAVGRSRAWLYGNVPGLSPMSEATRKLAERCLALRESGLRVSDIARKLRIPLATVVRLLAQRPGST
jgi:hypothetical protein